MPNKPLEGKTIILTGTSVVQSIETLIEDNGGCVKSFPLIETVEKITEDDGKWLAQLNAYDWLIFTSQTAVLSFIAKCIRHNLEFTDLSPKIAVVGEQTAALMQKANIQVHFTPSIYSADVFVKEFRMDKGERALFLRGSMAKSTIRNGTGADEWTVYETRDCLEHLIELNQCLDLSTNPIVIFASPSAVEVYAKHIVPNLDWSFVKVASIGHVTTAALAKYGVLPYVQPKTYTMKAVIEQLILEEQTS
jgi:uroporphyrinogen-III synthase